VNRYPTWKYALVALCVVVAALYTLPNFFGDALDTCTAGDSPKKFGRV